MRTLALIALTLSTPMALAADTAISLANYQVTSILYSSTSGRAFVGVMDDRGIGGYADCTAPAASPETIVKVNQLSDCKLTPGTSYIGDEATVDRINAEFPIALQDAYSEYVKEDARQAGAPNLIFVVPTIGYAIVGGIFAKGAFNSYSAGHRWMAAGKGAAAGGLFMISAATGLMSYFTIRQVTGETHVMSLESATIAAYQDLLASDPTAPKTILTSKSYHVTYDVIRSAILKSIGRTYSA